MLNMAIGLYCSAIYAVNYERGYLAADALEGIKREFLKAGSLRLRLSEDGRQMATLGRQVRSIQNEGIKVGQFCTLERLSTLNFVEFVSTKVASLLIAFIN